MKYIRVVNWEKFQHYKHRNPPWIRLYNSLLEKPEFELMPDASKFHFIAITLLASQCDNEMPLDLKWLERKMFSSEPISIETLVNSGFIEVYENASTMLADCMHDASGKPLYSDIDLIPKTKNRVQREFASMALAPDNNDNTEPEDMRILNKEFNEKWNEFAKDVNGRQMKSFTQSRKDSFKAKLNDPFWRDNWRESLVKARRSPFVRGEKEGTNGHPRFKANIDWFFRKDTVAKIMEGAYAEDEKKPLTEQEIEREALLDKIRAADKANK